MADKTHRFHQGNTGFTLVELLVVIGIIAVLIAILLPTIGRARAQSALAACSMNLRQLGAAHAMYAGENRGLKPPCWITYKALGTTKYEYDCVTPDIRRRGQPFGQGILVDRYLKGKTDILYCPASEMTGDVERDRTNWSNSVTTGTGTAGSSFVYFYRDDKNLPANLADFWRGGNYNQRDASTGLKQTALSMDISAEEGHTYQGEYQGRQWINHKSLRRMNILFVDGHVLSVPATDVQLKNPAGSSEEIAWFAQAHAVGGR
jgi:prepilin-type N-terminal cleavage/methylation domain-containing protein/prepilin-type processing-associated H-X9-DG protein